MIVWMDRVAADRTKVFPPAHRVGWLVLPLMHV